MASPRVRSPATRPGIVLLSLAVAACAGSSGISAIDTVTPTTLAAITDAPPAVEVTVSTAQPTTTQTTPGTDTPTTPPSLEDLYRQVEGGVLRVRATTCDGTGIGTGFLVAPDLMATAAHVVAGSVGVAVDDASGPVDARVIGLDPDLDVALLALSRPSAGYVFTIGVEPPQPGASVTAIGFPLDEPKTLTVGTISGLEREVLFDNGQRVVHLLQTDVALNPGNSGGPLLDRRGEVVGVVSGGRSDAQGINYAATASVAKPVLDAWRAAPLPIGQPSCDRPEGPEIGTPVSGPPIIDETSELAMRTFEAYFGGINAGDYERARVRIAPSRRPDAPTWEEALSSTYNFAIVVHEIAPAGPGATAWVTFTSLQAGDKGTRAGETCTLWSIDYTLSPADDGLLWLAGATGHAGGPISMPCA